MFRIEFFVDDKKLAIALRSLAGIAMGAPTVEPVINAEETPQGPKQLTNSGSAVEMFAEHLRRTKPTEVRPADARVFLKSIGRSPTSATYLLIEAVKAGLVKRGKGRGSQTNYLVV